jgi:hypothetical protein
MNSIVILADDLPTAALKSLIGTLAVAGYESPFKRRFEPPALDAGLLYPRNS